MVADIGVQLVLLFAGVVYPSVCLVLTLVGDMQCVQPFDVMMPSINYYTVLPL
jgi:hypothetical protein